MCFFNRLSATVKYLNFIKTFSIFVKFLHNGFSSEIKVDLPPYKSNTLIKSFEHQMNSFFSSSLSLSHFPFLDRCFDYLIILYTLLSLSLFLFLYLCMCFYVFFSSSTSWHQTKQNDKRSRNQNIHITLDRCDAYS